MSKSYCKYVNISPKLNVNSQRVTDDVYRWPVIAGIAIGGLLLIPIVWCFGRLICCHTFRRKGPGGPKAPLNSKKSSVFHPPPSKGYKPAPQPPPYESPKSAQLNCDNQGKASPETPQPLPGKTPEICHDEDVELGRLDPAHAPNASMLAHQEPTPMARLSPINTRNPHDSLHRPHGSLQRPFSSQHMSPNSPHISFESLHRQHDPLQQRHDSLHASHNSLHAQNSFSDPLATDCPPHTYRPPSPPQPYSPFAPQRPYSPYSPQRPYSPYLPYSPVSPYATASTKYESSMFVEHQQPYRAYSPSVSTHYEPSIWNEPVELPSPYNKRPESLIFAQGSQTSLVDNKSTSDTLLLQPQNTPACRASPTQPETKDTYVQEQQSEPKQPTPKISPELHRELHPEVNPVTGGAPPARTLTPGRAL